MIDENDLLRLIDSGATTLKRMADQEREAGMPDRTNGVSLERQLDLALQKARRKGLIVYESPVQGWRRSR